MKYNYPSLTPTLSGVLWDGMFDPDFQYLIRINELLYPHCKDCGHEGFIDPLKIDFPAETKLSSLKCSKCGSINVGLILVGRRAYEMGR